MANPLFQQLNQNPQLPNNGYNITDLIKQFNQFKQGFTGNPYQMVQQLLSNGRMSQQSFSKYSQMAREFQKLFPKF